MMNPPPLPRNTGLCWFDDREKWFLDPPSLAFNEAVRICGNCPVRRACAEAALDLGVTDGVWAGVRLPGARYIAALEHARERLRRVIAATHFEPESHRRRCLAIREALVYNRDLQRSRTGA